MVILSTIIYNKLLVLNICFIFLIRVTSGIIVDFINNAANYYTGSSLSSAKFVIYVCEKKKKNHLNGAVQSFFTHAVLAVSKE